MTTPEDFKKEWFSSAETVAAHTSGSTGAPKQIRLLKSDMRASAHATNRFFGLNGQSVFVCPLSPDYIAGKMMAVRAWEAGTEPVFLIPSNSPCLSGHASLLAIVPSQIPALLQAVKNGQFNVDAVLIGGAELPATSRKGLLGAGINAWESYGMTETCSHIALRHVTQDYFKARPGVTFGTDVRGCLVADVPHLSVKHIVTNDIIRLINPQCFVWLGRYDNVINTGGIKVQPEQLEKQLMEFGLSGPFYISSLPDPKWGQRIVLVAERQTCPADTELNEIFNALPGRYLIPKQIIRVDALPRTSNGKLRRLTPDKL